MHDPSRRRFLCSAAALTTSSVLAACARPQAIPRATAQEALPLEPVASRLSDIDHIIVLMKENRSFDHYFGTLAGVRGFDDAAALPLPSGRSVFHQPDAHHPDGYVLPFRLDAQRTGAQRLH